MGLWIAEITNPVLPEWAIGVLATLAACMFAYGVYGFLLPARKPTKAKLSTERTPKRLTERRLTDDEDDLLLMLDQQVSIYHGHSDHVKLAEDCLKGLDLSTGICHCGQPRSRTLL